MLIITNENLYGYEILKYLGYVSETVTFGINGVVEFFQIADSFGGESSIYRNTFNQAKDILDKRLEMKAREMGGNAIIGLRINYNEITGKNRSSILVSGTGTVVNVEMTEEYKIKLQERQDEIEQEQNNQKQARIKELKIKLQEQVKILKGEEDIQSIGDIENFSEIPLNVLIDYIEISSDKTRENLILEALFREDVKQIREKYKYFSLEGLCGERIKNQNSDEFKENKKELEKEDYDMKLEIILREYIDNISKIPLNTLIDSIENSSDRTKEFLIKQVSLREDVKQISGKYKYYTLEGLYEERIKNANLAKSTEISEKMKNEDFNMKLEIILRENETH